MYKAGGKTRSGKGHSCEHALADWAEAALFRQVMQRPGLLWRPVVVRIAIRQHKAPDAFGVACGENLGDPAAAVVGDNVHGIELHGLAERCEHARLRVEREVLIGAGPRRAMRKNIHRYAAPDIGNAIDHPVPEMTVQENAMNKTRHRSRSGLPVADVSELGRGIFAFLIS